MQNTNLKPTNIKSRDIFISYRRQCGGTVAAMLYELLKSKGFNIFFDEQQLQSGDYKENLEFAIKDSHNFILIVSKTVFGSDPVKEEIQIALDNNLNIIPIFVNEVAEKNRFPEEENMIIPPLLKSKNLNGIRFGYEKIEISLRKLIGQLVLIEQKRVIKTFISHYQEDDKNFENLLLHIKDIFDEPNDKKNFTDALIKLITETILLEISKKGKNSSTEILGKLFSAASTQDMKKIAKKLEVSSCGTHGFIVKRICANLINKNDILHYDKNQLDRYHELFEAVEAECKILKNRNELAEKLESKTREFISKSSINSVIYDIFENEKSVPEIFYFLK